MRVTLQLPFLIAICLLAVSGISLGQSNPEKIRVILDTDANNELDDQHAIAYLLFNGDVFDVEAITVNRTRAGGGVDLHLAEARRVVELCGLDGQIPVLRGADQSFEEIKGQLDRPDFDGAEAVNFIIERAKAADSRRLVLLPVGKLTNIALALAKEPSIIPKVRVVWLGSNYPDPGEYNQVNDEPSLNYILDSGVDFEIAIVRYGKPSGTDAVRATLDEIRKIMPGKGPKISPPVTGRHAGEFSCFGDYAISLFENITLHGDPPSRALFDMAAVAIVKNPAWARAVTMPAPILKDSRWVDRPDNPRKIILWENFDRDAIMADFYDRMTNYQLAQPGRAAQWEPVELMFIADRDYANPYTDVDLYVEFWGPDQRTLRRPAFWDGGRTWIVRLAAPATGRWTWRSECSQPNDGGLHHRHGELQVSAYGGDHPLTRHGLLKMSPGKRNVIHQDGTPFVMVADTPWALPWRGTVEAVTQYARDRQAKGFNAALLMTVQPDRDARGPRNRHEVGGFDVGFEDLPGGHLNRLRPEYFQMMDRLLDILHAHGIVPVLQPVFQGYGWKGQRVLGTHAVPAEYARYCRYLVARYGARPAMWLVSGDGVGAYPCTIAGGEEVERWDAYRQPTGFHYNPFDDYQPSNQAKDKCFHYNRSMQDAPWLDFQWCQTGHGGKHLPDKVRRMHDNQPIKAVANGEPTYEGIRDANNGAGWWQGHEAWLNLTAGGTMGVVYGAGGLWQWKLFADEPGWPAWANAPGRSWREAMQQEGSRYVGYVGRALAGYDITDMTKLSALGPQAVGKPGELYIVYLPEGGSATLTGLQRALPYRWFNPRTGAFAGEGRVDPQSPSLTAPSAEPWVLLAGSSSNGSPAASVEASSKRIQPYKANPRYWQYKGQPVLLLGGSDTVNPFNRPDALPPSGLESHLDLLVSVGGNYIRNTMATYSDGDLWPYHRDAETARYDLDRFNAQYWKRFDNFLRMTRDRDIIVQIEVFDRFDYARGSWDVNPFNPKNNTNYTAETSGLPEAISSHPGQRENPFFRSLPELEDNPSLLARQEALVEKMLSISLGYGNVLYCISNETNDSEEWSRHWAKFIRAEAAEAGIGVEVTEMWDAWNLNSPMHRRTFGHPDLYSYVDISQNNHQVGQTHWDNMQAARKLIAEPPRPMNNVKVYGGERHGGSVVEATRKLWHNILGGCASARFHRPGPRPGLYGVGLSELAQMHLRSARLFTAEFDVFRATPDAESRLLLDRQTNEAYLSYIPGEQYAVYFVDGGTVRLDLHDAQGEFALKWLDISNSRWTAENPLQGGRPADLAAPGRGQWMAIVLAR